MDFEKIAQKIKRRIENTPKDVMAYEDLLSLCVDWEQEGFKQAHAINKELRALATNGVLLVAPEDAERVFNVYKRTLLFDAKYDFDSFLRYIEIDQKPENKFYAPRAHYLKPMVQGYQDLLDKKIKLLTVSMPKRAGKALTLDTELVTPTGTILMRDVKVGTVLIGADGKPTTVTDVFPQGKVPIYEVKFRGGGKAYTCGNHLWEVKYHSVNKRGGSKDQYVTKIISTEKIYNSRIKCKTHNLYAVRFTQPVEYQKQPLSLHPYVMGALIGDGCLRDSSPMFTSFDAEIVNKISSLLPEGDIIRCQDAIRGKYLITTVNGLKNGGHKSTGTLTALRQYGVQGKLSYDKTIPEAYMRSDVEDRWELLRGLLDTDGGCTGKYIEFSTVSKQLAKQVQELVLSLGGDSRIHSRMGKYKKKTGEVVKTCINYRVSVMFPAGAEPFYLKRKRDKYSPSRTKLYHYIEEITPCGEKEAQCICVDNADHLFLLADHFVPTHNSQTEILFTLLISGLRPNNSTLMEGTGDALVDSFYKGALEYLREPNEYLFYDVFPDAKLVATNADTKIVNLANNTRFPTLMCRSIDARQVGLSEATNVLILDDCVEGREEAKNRQRLDDKWEVISGDVMGRALEGTPMIFTGTRYSLYDPIGRVQEEAEKQHWPWRAIEIPALDPITDESNYEYYNYKVGGLIFTTKFFREQREILSAEQFESEFQQQPFEAKGLLFDKKSLNYFFELPVDRDPDAIIAVTDTAESGEDSTAMVVAAIYGTEVYIIDVVFDNSPAEVTKPECAKCLMNNKVGEATFESNNAGTYFARDVAELCEQAGYMVGIRTKRTVSNKQTRIEMASDNIIKHFWFKHPSTYERGSQYWAFMKETTTYTRSGKVPHDDAPDSLSLLENEIRNLYATKVEYVKRPW